MLKIKEIRDIINDIQYLDWEIKLRFDGDRPYLQVFGHGPNPQNNMKNEAWCGRKWFVSYFMCKNEVIRTAYKAIECAVAHEMNENFLYKGLPVFTPHMDYDKIIQMMNGEKYIDARDNGMLSSDGE
jgi:hypothetical protein